MSKRFMGALVVVVLFVAGGWILAQPGPAGPKKADAAVGRYSISPMGTTAILLDTTDGKTWVLHPDAQLFRPATWLPAERIDDPRRAKEWLANQEEVKQAQAEAQRREAERRTKP